jgi:hypothetical protein
VDDGGGYESQEEALLAAATFLASDFAAASEADLKEAVTSTTGDTRFEADSGKVFIGGSVQAELNLVQLSDGTWTVDFLRYCSVPTDDPGEPGPTPSETVRPSSTGPSGPTQDE